MKERQIWEPAKVSDFHAVNSRSFPWEAEAVPEIRKFGDSYVIKWTSEDKMAGDKIIYRLYEKSTRELPTVDESKPEVVAHLDRHLMLLDGLLHKNMKDYYTQSGQELMWPTGARSTPINSDAHFLWQKAQKLRVQEICNAVFPESKEGYLSSLGQVVQIVGNKLTVWDLDDIVDSATLNVTGIADTSKDALEPYLGYKVFSEILGTGELTKINTDKYIVKWRIRCMTPDCKNRITVYTMSGCHKGAYCYVCDPKTGEYLADLRNQLAVCNDCAQPKRKIK